MTALLSAAAFRLVGTLVLATTLILLIDRLEHWVPRGSRLEAVVQRWSSAGQGLVAVVGLLIAVDVVYGADLLTGRWLTVGVFATVAWSARRALSDWANGITLRSEGSLQAGGRIGVGDQRGRVRRLGLRSVEVEAEDGKVLRFPYTALAESHVEVGGDEEVGRSHTFTVDLPSDVDAGELTDRIVAGALLSSWSSAAPLPHVRVVDRGTDGLRFEVTVYPVDAALAGRVEEAVRAVV